jgi:autotransporter-associated beta strand protein
MKASLQIPRHFLASLIVLAGTQANGADLYWDADGDTTADTGGTGAWNLTDNFWRDGSAEGTLVPWSNDNVAQLGGTYGTLTIPASTAIAVNRINVLSDTTGTAPYTIATANVTTGTLTFTGADKTIDVAAGTTLTVTGAGLRIGQVSDTGAGQTSLLTIQGGGTLNLSATNRVYAGALRATGAGTTVRILGTNGLDSGTATIPVTVDDGATFEINTTNNYRVNMVLGGTGLAGGTLKFGQFQAIATQGANRTITVLGTSKSSIISTLPNTGTANADFGSISASNQTRPFNVNPTGDPSGVDLEYSAGLRGGTLAKNNAGVMRLNNGFYVNRANDFTTFAYTNASLNVNAGVFLNEGRVLGMTTVGTNGTARTGTSTGSYDAVTVNGNGVFELSRASDTFTSGLTFDPGQNSLTLNNGGTLKYVGVNPDISPLLNTLNGSGGGIDTNGQNVTFATALTGTGGLVKKGSGTLTLEAPNTYGGLTSVTGGSLILGAAASIDPGAGIHVGAGATADLSAVTGTSYSIGTVLPQTLSGGGTLIATGKEVVLGSNATLAPGDGAGTLQVDLGSGSLDVSAVSNFVFEVGATSDRLLVPAGTLNIGDGTLGFSDFIFSSSGGLATGDYVLFESTDLNGTLDPADLGGTFGPFSGTLSISGGNVVLSVVASPFDTFMETFSTQIPNPANRVQGADPDGDGVDNLTEFALYGNPADASNNGLVAVLIQDTDVPADTPELTLVAAVRRGAVFTTNGDNAQVATEDGIVYQVEGSLTLDLWTSPVSAVAAGSDTAPAASGLNEDLGGTDWQYRTFVLDASEGLPAKGFLRIQVAE